MAGGGQRHYYAHLSAFADIREGQFVDVDTVLGFVGNTGNAQATPPHPHFGVYAGSYGTCNWDAIDPLPYLVDRPAPAVADADVPGDAGDAEEGD